MSDSVGEFDLRAPEEKKEKAPTPGTVLLTTYGSAWAVRYGRPAAAPDAMLRSVAAKVCAEQDHGELALALAAFMASDEAGVIACQHAFPLFAKQAVRWIVAATQPTVRASRLGPVYDADAAADRLERQRERDARAEQVMADAVVAFNAMSADGQAALRRIAEAELQEYRRTMPGWMPTADECRRRIAERMVGLLVDHGRGRSMAETAHDFEPRANAQGVA